MSKNIKKTLSQRGEISRLLLILAGGVFIVIIVVLAVLFFTKANKSKVEQPANAPVAIPEPPKPVYEKQMGDINFVLQSSEDLGNTLKAPNKYQKDLTTTEKFIRVMVGAQNKGKISTSSYGWDIGNIIDSEGRVFESINAQAYAYLPQPNPCGLSLKPEFYPISCTKIYEVSKASKGMKVEISAKDQKEKQLLDLNFNQ